MTFVLICVGIMLYIVLHNMQDAIKSNRYYINDHVRDTQSLDDRLLRDIKELHAMQLVTSVRLKDLEKKLGAVQISANQTPPTRSSKRSRRDKPSSVS